MRHNFRELQIWRQSFDLVKEIYYETNELPNEEKFGLTSQIRRSAVSIPSNIAEGSGRTTTKEFCHFLNIAISSSFELETQLMLAHDIFALEITTFIDKIHSIQRMIVGLRNNLSE